MTATDEDDGINSRLTYTFEGLGSDNPFSIDSECVLCGALQV